MLCTCVEYEDRKDEIMLGKKCPFPLWIYTIQHVCTCRLLGLWHVLFVTHFHTIVTQAVVKLFGIFGFTKRLCLVPLAAWLLLKINKAFKEKSNRNETFTIGTTISWTVSFKVQGKHTAEITVWLQVWLTSELRIKVAWSFQGLLNAIYFTNTKIMTRFLETWNQPKTSQSWSHTAPRRWLNYCRAMSPWHWGLVN